ncbi:MAG: metallophosphoesterase, partial [Rhodospirillales bacterium]|nr:metallophosphoesterase [Rhodospirillales bacterium]
MKVAIFSDVQANLPAMEVAVERILDWDPDLVVMDGDLV